MRNTFLLLLIVLAAMDGRAQLGFEGGVNMATMDLKSMGTKIKTTYKTGASFGIIGDIRVSDNGHIYFETGVLYQGDGAKITDNPNWEFQVNTLTIPLFIEYKSGARCGERFFAGGGPYVRRILNGYEAFSFSGTSGTSGSTTELQVGTDIKTMDYGVGVNFGYLSKGHMYIRANYLYGLSNDLPGGNSDNVVKMSSGGVTLGYMIRGCSTRSRSGGGGRNRDHWRGIKKGRWSRRSIFRKPNGPDYY